MATKTDNTAAARQARRRERLKLNGGASVPFKLPAESLEDLARIKKMYPNLTTNTDAVAMALRWYSRIRLP